MYMCCFAVLMFNDKLDVISITEAEENSETTATGVMLFNSGYTATITDYRSMRNKISQQCYVFKNRYTQISDSGQDNMTVLSSTQIHSAVLPFTSTANHSLCYFSIDFEVCSSICIDKY